MEEIIVLIMIFLSLLTIYCLYRLLSKRGLYFSLVILNLITFVLTFKITNAFKMNINIGIVPLISFLTIIYIFINKYGDKDIKNLERISLYSSISTALLLIIMNFFVPAITETISINMQGTFEYNYKILILYPFMILLSIHLITKLYKIIGEMTTNIWLRTILTYIITGLIYTIIFYILCYINIMEFKYSLFLGITTYIIGIPISLINIAFISYINNKKVIK